MNAAQGREGSWLGHYSWVVLIGTCLFSAVPFEWRPGWASLVAMGLAVAAVMWGGAHDRGLCARCARALPTDPQAAVDRHRPTLGQFHYVMERAAGTRRRALTTLVLFLVVFVVSMFVAPDWWGTVVRFALGAVFGPWLLFASHTHRRLGPWCPWCGDRDDDADEALRLPPGPRMTGRRS